MKWIQRKATFLGLNVEGESVYLTSTGIVSRRRPRAPWSTEVVRLLLDLVEYSPTDYEAYRNGSRKIDELLREPCLQHTPEVDVLRNHAKRGLAHAEGYIALAEAVMAGTETLYPDHRVYEVARLLNVSSETILDALRALGFRPRNLMSRVTASNVTRLQLFFCSHGRS